MCTGMLVCACVLTEQVSMCDLGGHNAQTMAAVGMCQMCVLGLGPSQGLIRAAAHRPRLRINAWFKVPLAKQVCTAGAQSKAYCGGPGISIYPPTKSRKTGGG